MIFTSEERSIVFKDFFLELGKTLAKASAGLSKKTFKKLKDGTANELGKNNIRNIDKVVKVAKSKDLEITRTDYRQVGQRYILSLH